MFPSEVKTGFAACNNETEMSAFQVRLLALLALLIENSLTGAIVYSSHAGIEEVDDALMRNALMVEAMQFFDRDSLENDVFELEKEMVEIDEMSELDEMSDDEEENEDEDGEEEGDDDDGLPPVELDADGVCRCEFCKRFKTVDADWETWDVADDPAKQFLRSHINNL